MIDDLNEAIIIPTDSKSAYESFLKEYHKKSETKSNKIRFLNELYEKEITVKSMWSIYLNHIVEHEIELGKDIMFFNNLEVDEIIANRFMFTPATKNGILNFISKYKDWGVSKKIILNNSTKALNRKSTVKSSQKIVMNKVWGLVNSIIYYLRLKENLHLEIRFLYYWLDMA
jgi:hypothetical protein